MPDQLIRATVAEGGIRIIGATTTDLCQEARERHQLSYVASAALARAMTAGLLLAATMKQTRSRVNLRMKGNGPMGGLLVDAGLDGKVRGYVNRPHVEIPLNDQGSVDVGAAIGDDGYLYIIRDTGKAEPYASTVSLVSGEVVDDVAHYLARSEQTPSGLSLGVFLETKGITAAGGLLVQVLPKAAQDEDLVELLESRLQTIAQFSLLLQRYASLEGILNALFGDMDLQIFPEKQPLHFHCPCTSERVNEALKLLGKDELTDMMNVDKGAETTCDFCGTVYTTSESDLERIIAQI